MATSKINSITTPEGTAPAPIHEYLASIVEQMVQHEIMTFSSSTERSNAFTTLGITPLKGALSYLQDVGRYEYYNGTGATGWVELLSTGSIVSHGHRITNSAGSTTTVVGVLRLDDVPVKMGRVYKIQTSQLHLLSTVADDHVEARITYTTDGSPAGIASTTLPGGRSQGRLSVNAGFGEDRSIQTLYSPPSDLDLSLLLCVRRDSGSGSASIAGTSDFEIRMWVEDCGVDPGDTGVVI